MYCICCGSSVKKSVIWNGLFRYSLFMFNSFWEEIIELFICYAGCVVNGVVCCEACREALAIARSSVSHGPFVLSEFGLYLSAFSDLSLSGPLPPLYKPKPRGQQRAFFLHLHSPLVLLLFTCDTFHVAKACVSSHT